MQLGLQLKNAQQLKLNLTPALKQSIDILQMPTLDLSAYLQEVALDNPVIDIEVIETPIFSKKSTFKREYNISSEDADDPLTFIGNKSETLEQYIIRQLSLCKAPKPILKAAMFLAGNLNDDGYLDIELQTASSLLGQSMEVMLQALKLLQSMDPPGIGARDLKECLLIQINFDPNAPELAKSIVQHFFMELAYTKLETLAHKLKTSTEQIASAVNYIKQLDPRPGLRHYHESQPLLIPDGEISYNNHGFSLQIYNHYLPKIAINREYLQWSKQHNHSDVSPYLKEKIHQAKWLMRSLNQRTSTLQRVIENVVNKQKAFLIYGEHVLKPLTLKEISTELNLHESTVSRAVQHKSIQTPNGIVELKQFFSSGSIQAQGQAVSQTSIKKRIRDLINNEPKSKPLSDNQIAALLNKEGFQLSRRTVAKYREDMRILSSVLRKNI